MLTLLVGVLLAFVSRYLSLRFQIALVPNEYDFYLLISMVSDLIEPLI